VLAASQCKGRGRLGRWILRLYLFTFKVQHSVDTGGGFLVKDVGRAGGGCSGGNYLALLQNLPLVYLILDQYKGEDPSFRSLIEGLSRGEAVASNFLVHKALLCYQMQRG